MVTKDRQWCTFTVLRISTTHNRYNNSKYAWNIKFPIITPYMHPLHALHTPLTCLMCSPYVPYMHPLCTLCTPLTCLTHTPYAHPLQDSDWLMSPPHPMRSMELNNLISIKSWFFFPTTSLKSLHAARIDELADSNEPAKIHFISVQFSFTKKRKGENISFCPIYYAEAYIVQNKIQHNTPITLCLGLSSTSK